MGSKTETTKKVLAWSVCDMGTVLQSHESAFDRRTVPMSHKSQPFFLLNRIFSVVLDLFL